MRFSPGLAAVALALALAGCCCDREPIPDRAAIERLEKTKREAARLTMQREELERMQQTGDLYKPEEFKRYLEWKKSDAN